MLIMEKVLVQLRLDAGDKVLAQLPTDFIARCQTEQMGIHGDPAITINEQKLPDYDIEAQHCKYQSDFYFSFRQSF